MKTTKKSVSKYLAFSVLLAAVVAAGSLVYGQSPATSGGKLNVFGDTVFFYRAWRTRKLLAQQPV